ncbi:GNAT family N-acetyltransferase [uncultured Croceitalea sp.]|uniref:GNAT family N-acetyltransferase n=1 Tax=uncultured Croceitalea sp. TaxID=1798908 RepID=UPI00374E694F
MRVRKNPFTTPLYERHWIKNFCRQKKKYSFDILTGISFTKIRLLPLFINIGLYKSFGMSYSIETSVTKSDFKKKVFIIYDVPEYFEINNKNEILSIKKISQYEGFLIDLSQYSSINEYIYDMFSSRRRKSLLLGLKKLEKNNTINYKWFHGKIERNEYSRIFKQFYDFIDIKFKQQSNSHSSARIKEWYEPLFFDLINKKQGSFFVIENNEEPIAISFNYHSENIFFAAIPSYDLKYMKYGIGNIQTLKEIEWSIQQKYEGHDLGKGSYGYKHRWSRNKYNYEYHIIYDKKSIRSIILGKAIVAWFILKQFIRKIYHSLRSIIFEKKGIIIS